MGWIRPTKQRKIRNNSLSMYQKKLNVKRCLLYPEDKNPEKLGSNVTTKCYFHCQELAIERTPIRKHKANVRQIFFSNIQEYLYHHSYFSWFQSHLLTDLTSAFYVSTCWHQISTTASTCRQSEFLDSCLFSMKTVPQVLQQTQGRNNSSITFGF